MKTLLDAKNEFNMGFIAKEKKQVTKMDMPLQEVTKQTMLDFYENLRCIEKKDYF